MTVNCTILFCITVGEGMQILRDLRLVLDCFQIKDGPCPISKKLESVESKSLYFYNNFFLIMTP